MSWEIIDTSFVRFDRYLASNMRTLLSPNNPQIPKVLMELIKPKEYATSLKVCHNWGDIIPYPISIVFKVYSFQGNPHVLPFYVPLKVGIVKFLWQVGGLEEE